MNKADQKYKFLGNVVDPDLSDHELSASLIAVHGLSIEATIQAHRNYCYSITIKEPVATDTYTVEQLEGFNMVGAYKAL